MILGFLRLFAFLLIAQIFVYGVAWLYLRSLKREALENEWADSGAAGAIETYVRDGMLGYAPKLRARLFWGVGVAPIVGLIILLYVLGNS